MESHSRNSSEPMRAVLVTGGAGFIGSHLIEWLLKQGGLDIVCLDNFSSDYDSQLKSAHIAGFTSSNRVKILKADFCQENDVRELFEQHRFDAVVHLGALAGVRRSAHYPLDYQQTNVQGTLNVLEASRRHPVRRFILVSSSTAYGDGVNVPFEEDGPLGIPLSTYGATKRAAEILAFTYQRTYGVPVVCVRPFSVYGPRMRPDLALPRFASAILADRPIILFGNGSVRRDFTHVDDVCRGIMAALYAAAVEGEAINLGYGTSIAMNEVVTMLETVIGRTAQVQFEPQAVEDIQETRADTRKARRLLGFQASISFEAGLTRYCKDLLAHERLTSQAM